MKSSKLYPKDKSRRNKLKEDEMIWEGKQEAPKEKGF